MIKHLDENNKTFYSLYAHLSQVNVKVGQQVKAKEIIDKEGGDPNKDNNPGSSTGHNLHFEIRTPTDSKNDKIDPSPLFLMISLWWHIKHCNIKDLPLFVPPLVVAYKTP